MKKLGFFFSAISLASALVATTSFADQNLERVIVQFKPGKTAAGLAIAENVGASVERALLKHHAFAIEVPSAALPGLERNPNIEFVEPDHKRYLNSQSTPYGIPMVQAPAVSDALAHTQTICIIDSGINITHEDLHAGWLTGTNDSGTGLWSTDENGHGTHVAGTIAAVNND